MSKIIHISDAASIAIHSLSIIASSKNQINISQIAEMTGFSKNHLYKIMQILVKNNYIKSARGPKGGFVINGDSKKINLLEIYELIEGRVVECNCTSQKGKCIFKKCIFGGVPEKLSKEFKNYLQKTFLLNVAPLNI
ncbi:MAG TPA: Rrf2 family transcriptional regulator [Bacteroidales bacterium]|nr:Rrf2 family transcriptional regulator [Bacteroidales bacterium]HPS17707.1 Rrf2 family transcriptional regulator [Bacteroidales bacterium]